MDFDETMVDEMIDNEGNEELPEEIVEEDLDESEDLSSITDSDEEEQPAEEEPKKKGSQGTSEPGWFKKRWDKEVGKLTAQIREEIRNEYEAQMAPIRERMMEDEAQELVRSRKVADIETARELVRLRNGQPAAAPAKEQPRQQNGQFAQKTSPLLPNTLSTCLTAFLFM